MKRDFGKGRKFRPDEVVFYMKCVHAAKSEDLHPCLDKDQYIRELYNDNRQPTMRSLEEIELDSKLK